MKLIRPADLSPATAGAFTRGVAASADTTGASRLWVAYTEIAPGGVSGAHHHGIAETVVFVLQGSARFFFGDGLGEAIEASGGDFVWIPPSEVHAEMNASATDQLRMLVVRSPYDITIEADGHR